MPTKAQLQTSSKKISESLFNLSPNTLITLFEIDLEPLAIDRGITLQDNDKIFRFHTNIKLLNTAIFWRGNKYTAAPVKAEGFEMTGRGTLPTPKLAISVSPEGIPLLGTLKQRIRQFDDLVGAKVTRIRTFAENLDSENFENSTFTPDPNAELPRDIYFIDRKSAENKTTIEFELASTLDIEGVKLPGRIVLGNRCVCTYRGEGCLYEYKRHWNVDIHGGTSNSIMPEKAPPVATDRDERIIDIIKAIDPSITSISEPEYYNAQKLSTYVVGSSVYITKVPYHLSNNQTPGELPVGINYYFVCISANPPFGPPDTRYWVQDSCSKLIRGCKLRYDTIQYPGHGNKKVLPFVGFPSSQKIR